MDGAIDVALWLEEGKFLFGEDALCWRFRCPVCSNVATPGDFKRLGTDPNRASQECVACDFSAFGLLPVGVRLVFAACGSVVRVFPFAPCAVGLGSDEEVGNGITGTV